ncbi:MAG: hypothetical protein NVV73_15500 [Cellvibrionaceae bacterium]|nr:hypothetical protein [Cellvibrionaceae bacterium]
MTMTTNELPVIHALWVGNKLGDISRCCLKSFLLRGHRVHLHAYEEIQDVPEGVTLVEGSKIISRDEIVKHRKTASYALFSDLFRYRLLEKEEGIYVDCDVYCLSPLQLPESGYLLGLEEDGRVNGAVLAMPRESALLERLLVAARDPFFIPPWYKASRRKRLSLKKSLGFGTRIENMPWGALGPDAITHYIKELQLFPVVQPIDVFYPIHHKCVGHLLDGDLDIKDVTTHRTTAVHLYNERLRGLDLKSLNANCVLQKFLRNEA